MIAVCSAASSALVRRNRFTGLVRYTLRVDRAASVRLGFAILLGGASWPGRRPRRVSGGLMARRRQPYRVGHRAKRLPRCGATSGVGRLDTLAALVHEVASCKWCARECRLDRRSATPGLLAGRHFYALMPLFSFTTFPSETVVITALPLREGSANRISQSEIVLTNASH